VSAVRRQQLSKNGIDRIVRAIQASDEKEVMSWKYVQRLAGEYAGSGYVWTRQALERHLSIKEARHAHEGVRRKNLKGQKRKGRLSEPEKMARLEQENERLRRQLDRYDELFATYLANAVAHGLSHEELSRPLEKPTRGGGNSDKS
jgi:hypothetical protein